MKRTSRCNRLSTVLLLWIIAFTGTYANITGTVFRDLPFMGTAANAYGSQQANESGVADVNVTAYNASGTVAATTLTGSDGTYTLATGAGDYRIEFSNWDAYLKESVSSTTMNASVRFASDGDTIDFGLHNPADYADTTSRLATTFEPNAAEDNAAAFTLKMLATADIPDIGEHVNDMKGSSIAFMDETGTLWGLAYDGTSDALYASTMLRRHGAIGPLGLGGIYKIDITDPANPVVTQFATVADAGDAPANAARDLGAPGHDSVFDEVGRVGLGDLDLSEDGTQLYTINLHTNALITIPLADPTSQTAYPIGNPFGNANCPDDDVASWGIGQHDGKLYVGSVCTTNTAQGAYISLFNGATFTPLHQIPLDMVGEAGVSGGGVDDQRVVTRRLADDKRWRTWITDYHDLFDGTVRRMSYPAPILSDIVFDETGGMIVGFIDRSAMQSGLDNYSPDDTDGDITYKYDASGDMYRVCFTGGTYYNEGAAECAQHDTAGSTPGVLGTDTDHLGYPEFFIGEEWDVNDTYAHRETALGGLAYRQGYAHVATTSFDPVPILDSNYNSNGFMLADMTTGDKSASQIIIDKSTNQYNAKAGGIGDIEFLDVAAPVEIGDRVWYDHDGDGVQDADESGISGVTVQLLDAGGAVLATATTDANGTYIFSNDPAGSSTASHIYNITDLVPRTAYTVRIPNIGGGSQQAVLASLILTTADIGEGPLANLNDSDGAVNGSDADANVTVTDIPQTGANNHSFDFGFTPRVSIGSLVWDDADRDGVQDAAEGGIAGATVELLDCTDTAIPGVATQTTGADGLYYFGNLPEGSYKVRVTPPGDYAPSAAQTAADNDDSANDSNIATSDAANNTYTSGCFALTHDGEPDGVDSAIPGSDDADNDDDNNGNMTVDFAFYVPKVCVGSLVWNDADDDGIQDAAESGISGVAVELLDAAGAVISTATTNGSGVYSFCNLNEGNYSVRVTQPAGFVKSSVQTTADNDDNVNDSNIKTTAGDKHTSGLFEVTEDDEPIADSDIAGTDTEDNGDADNANLSIDFGFVQAGSWSGNVSKDTDNDGNGDVMLQNVTITLYTDPDGDGDPADGTKTGTTSTDTNGDYIFTELHPGNYVAIETQPSGLSNVSENEGGTDDDKPNNHTVNSIAGTVDAGENDAGNDFVEKASGKLCGKVTEDTDNDDIGEQPIAGVTLTLYDTNGHSVATTSTNTNGEYCFNDLPAGDYTVKETQPDGYINVLEKEGGDDADKPDNMEDNSIAATIDEGETDTGNDFVEEKPETAYRIGDLFWIDADGDGEYDSSELVISNAKVELLDEDGNVIGNTTTDANGRYHFDVPKGKYRVRFYIPQELLDDGYSFVTVQKTGNETNKANANGIIEQPVEVGPGIATQNLTLDAGINCPCANIVSNSVNALSFITILFMALGTLLGGLLLRPYEEV